MSRDCPTLGVKLSLNCPFGSGDRQGSLYKREPCPLTCPFECPQSKSPPPAPREGQEDRMSALIRILESLDTLYWNVRILGLRTAVCWYRGHSIAVGGCVTCRR